MHKTLALALIAALLLSCSQTPEQKMKSLAETINEQIDRYQFSQAQQTLDRISELNPGSLLIPYYTGLISERSLCYQDALNDYLTVTGADANNGPALAGLCRSYMRLGEYTGAVRAASEYTRVKPKDPQAAVLRAQAMIGLGQLRGAAREIESATGLGLSEPISNLMIARVEHLMGDVDSARVLRGRVMAEAETNLEFLTHAAELYETVGLIDSAVQFSRRAVETDPGNHDVLMDHFFRCLRHGYWFDARRAIQRIPAEGGGETVRTGLWLHYYLADNKRSKARETASDFRRLTEGALMSVSLEIQARANSSDFTSAATQISTMQHILTTGDYPPEFRDYMLYSVEMYYPEIVAGLENIESLQKLPSEYANAPDVQLRIAYLMHKVGDFDGYKEFVSVLEEYHRSQPDWLTGIADIDARTNVRKFEEAERLYGRALELDHWYRPAFEHQVAMYRSLRRYADALDMFDRYAYFADQYPELKLLKASVLVENGRLDDAQAALVEGAALVGGEMRPVAEYLDLIKRRGETERATPVIDMLTADSDNPDRLLMAAIWDCNLDRFQAALDLADKALSIESDNADGYAIKARALHGLGKTSEAYALFEENHERDRDNILNNLYHSRLLAEDEIDLDRACNIAREANADAYGDLDVWMNLSYVYFQAGRYDLSRGEALKASRSYPNRPEPYFRIGMAMYEEGNPETRENFQKAIALGLAGEQLERAKETMAKM